LAARERWRREDGNWASLLRWGKGRTAKEMGKKARERRERTATALAALLASGESVRVEREGERARGEARC
jgi:hypothetical protein